MFCNEDLGYKKFYIHIEPYNNSLGHCIDWKVIDDDIGVLLRGNTYDTEICLKYNTQYRTFEYDVSCYGENFYWKLYDEFDNQLVNFYFSGNGDSRPFSLSNPENKGE